MPKIKDLTIKQLYNICDLTNCLDCPLQVDNQCIKSTDVLTEEYLNRNVDLSMTVYQKICVGCERERYCHEECETCEEYQNWYNKLWGLTDE